MVLGQAQGYGTVDTVPTTMTKEPGRGASPHHPHLTTQQPLNALAGWRWPGSHATGAGLASVSPGSRGLIGQGFRVGHESRAGKVTATRGQCCYVDGHVRGKLHHPLVRAGIARRVRCPAAFLGTDTACRGAHARGPWCGRGPHLQAGGEGTGVGGGREPAGQSGFSEFTLSSQMNNVLDTAFLFPFVF